MPTLALDAATYAGTVAVLDGPSLLAERTTAMRGAHEERLMPAVADALAAAGIAAGDIDRIVCGSGPGSFTSLRIAASIAKGLATGLGCPLHAVSSLALIVAAEPRAPGSYLAVLPALRGEVFAQLVDVGADGLVSPAAEASVLDESALADATVRPIRPIRPIRIGPGQSVEAAPHARGVARLAPTAGLARPVDLVSWEPDYGRVAEAQARWEAAHGRPLPRG
ncbi:MAG TPA: tRNA (adenosine(37)-N6)-threonylcarbamoyltransferase complex dimerization subunit type 1 TsaB [Gemmatimonadaceae bacterium]|nr:tRNA (adenosine(37)-N6)-threonylcarbamoyltransferase complex dimerization subunit type 1 TsaB [Gemmatimonadaceae bacterium]